MKSGSTGNSALRGSVPDPAALVSCFRPLADERTRFPVVLHANRQLLQKSCGPPLCRGKKIQSSSLGLRPAHETNHHPLLRGRGRVPGSCPAFQIPRARYLTRMREETHVLYNDTCPVCRTEIDAYARRALAEGLPLRFDRLERAADWGLTHDQAARRLHVRHRGQVLSGLAAFRALWAEMPHLRWLARVTGWPIVAEAAAGLYDYVLAPLLYRLHLRRLRSGRQEKRR